MKNIRLGSAVLAALAIAGTARAADLPLKAPPQAAPVSWTGFYAGAGLGFRSAVTDAPLVSELTAGIDGAFAPGDLSGVQTAHTLTGTAFRASPYVGFNWQFAPSWVSGIEADFGFADKTVTRDGVFLPTGLNGIDPSNTDTLSVRTSWDASLRGRLGYLATPAVLAYATGGVAWQRYDITSACQCTSAVDSTSLTPTTITQSTTRVGWTVGGGLETMLWDHWLARAEYRYADFGRSLFNVNRSGEFLDHVFSSIDTLDVKLRTHTVTFGLAYKFN